MTNQSNLNLDSILDKIKNLIELAADTPDDAEGQNAILLAQKLMLKHNIDMSQIEELSPKKDETVTTQHYQQTRVFWWQTELSVIIAKHFRCRVTRQRVYNIDYDRYETKLIFYGFDMDAKIAQKTFTGALLYLKYRLKRMKGASKHQRTSYLKGFLQGLKKKLREQQEELVKMNQKYELVLTTPQIVNQYVDKVTNGASHNYSAPIYHLDPEMYQTGFEQGKNAKILENEILES